MKQNGFQVRDVSLAGGSVSKTANTIVDSAYRRFVLQRLAAAQRAPGVDTSAQKIGGFLDAAEIDYELGDSKTLAEITAKLSASNTTTFWRNVLLTGSISI